MNSESIYDFFKDVLVQGEDQGHYAAEYHQSQEYSLSDVVPHGSVPDLTALLILVLHFSLRQCNSLFAEVDAVEVQADWSHVGYEEDTDTTINLNKGRKRDLEQVQDCRHNRSHYVVYRCVRCSLAGTQQFHQPCLVDSASFWPDSVQMAQVYE